MFGSALVPRIGLVVRSGGPRGTFGYDPSVYYAAAVAVLHHRVPYRDFVLLHPPGMLLFLTPFAWLGDHTSDHRGFVAATLAFIVLGALNAVLVMLVARRAGLGRGAALVGGLFYAAWPGTADPEYAIQLETLGSVLLLAGLLAYQRAEASDRRRWSVVCGAALAGAAAVKIWSVVPLLLLLAWQLRRARRDRLPYYLAGASGALLLIVVPFFALAPHAMWSMVVTDQLHRANRAAAAARLTGLTGIRSIDVQLANQHPALVITLAAVLLLVISALALRAPGGALFVALMAATLAVLIVSPSWFGHYNGLIGPGLALTVAAAAAVAGDRLRLRTSLLRSGVAATLVVAVAAASLVAATVIPKPPIGPYPSAAFARAVRHLRCVMSDAPMPLIEMNVLSRDLHNGCPNWIDVTGRTYEPGGPGGSIHARTHDQRWQRELARYLFSGQAVTIYRITYTGIGAQLRRRLHRQPVLARGRGYILHAT